MNYNRHLRLARGCLKLIRQMEAAGAKDLMELEEARATLMRQKKALRKILDNHAALTASDFHHCAN